MSGVVYYVCDLETSGLMWKNNFHEITELSILRAHDRVQLSRQVKVNYPEHASFDALRITGKTVDDLKKGISKQQLINDVEEFLSEDNLTPEHRCLVGHNIINFDRKFLWQQWEVFNKYFPFSLYLDTLNMSKDYAKKIGLVKPSLKLGPACDLLGIEKRAGSHNAKSDTRNCYLLWQKLMDKVDHLEHIKRIPHIENND
jgi:DNA polymerase III epsilon subunit-like protein